MEHVVNPLISTDMRYLGRCQQNGLMSMNAQAVRNTLGGYFMNNNQAACEPGRRSRDKNRAADWLLTAKKSQLVCIKMNTFVLMQMSLLESAISLQRVRNIKML